MLRDLLATDKHEVKQWSCDGYQLAEASYSARDTL